MRFLSTFGLLLVLISLLAFPSLASAAPVTHNADVVITANEEAGTIQLTATTARQGTTFSDSWTGVDTVGSVVDAQGRYVSTASLQIQGAGVYTVTYNVTMGVPGGNVVWEGTRTVTLTVVDGSNRFSFEIDGV